MTDTVETGFFCEPPDVNRRLAELQLTKKGLDRVRTVAIAASADTTDFHPSNAPGTFAYHQGTWALRDEFVGEHWIVHKTDGIEAIANSSLKIKVIFANVDIACNDVQGPKPRSRKGAGSERACLGNMFRFLPTYSIKEDTEWATYYLMVDPDGTAELTRPVVRANTFKSYVERIYLGPMDFTGDDNAPSDQDDSAVDLDPVVARKKA